MRSNMNRMTLLFLPRMYYCLDMAVGVLLGSPCPNCRAPGKENRAIAHRFGGVIAIRRCNQCGVLYRPAGIVDRPLIGVYYSFLYSCAGVATSPSLSKDPEELERAILLEGKDRTGLVQAEAPGGPLSICVLGCSWGYELILLARAGHNVFGVEPGKVRREYGKRGLGLNIYESTEAAAADNRTADVLLSSHVLEHVPRIDRLMDSIARELNPKIQIHITPFVDDFGIQDGRQALVGREHPLGITRHFWDRTAERLGLRLAFKTDGDEAIAVLRRGN